MKTDIEIAQEAVMLPITEVAKQSAQAANIMIAGDFQTLALYKYYFLPYIKNSFLYNFSFQYLCKIIHQF